MNVLVIDSNDTHCAELASVIASAGHSVVAAPTPLAARAHYGKAPLHTVVVSARAVDGVVMDAFRGMRQHEALRRSYLLALLDDISDEQLVGLYDAGADGHLRGKIVKPVILARLRATERFLREHGALTAGAPTAEPAREATPLDTCVASNAWRSAMANIESAASQLLTLPATAGKLPDGGAPVQMATAITMVSALTKVELRIAVGIDTLSAKTLSTHMFGEEGDDLAGDMLGEVTNIFMGAMKTALNAESLGFAAGLPGPLKPEYVERPEVPFPHQAAFALRVGPSTIVVHLGMRSKADQAVLRKNLTEGMVLAKDVFNGRGVLLIAGGTRLSQHMIERLGTLLAPTSTIEVISP